MKKNLLLTIFMVCMLLLAASCSLNSNSLIGKWEFNAAENQEDDMTGIKIEFTDDIMYLTNEKTYKGYTLEAKYFKDDECIYIQSITMGGQTEVYDEFMEFPYNIDGKQLILDMEEADLGTVILKKQ